MGSTCLEMFGRVTLLLAVMGALGSMVPARADTFDAPIEKKVVDLGLSPSNAPGEQNLRIKLSCWFYPGFLVKEYNDAGEKGAKWIAIVPSQGAATPACSPGRSTGERRIQWPEWSGYFKGAKGNLVFIDDVDGVNGGMRFVVFDSRTAKRIFEDSAYDPRLWRTLETSVPSGMQFRRGAGEEVLLTYLRVVDAGCDLHLDADSCWKSARKRLALESDQPPVCADYEGVSSHRTSMVAYPVEVLFSPRPSRKNVAGPIKCWPVE